MIKKKNKNEIIWDESNVNTVYANISNVTATREEIALVFGTSQAGLPQREGVNVKLKKQIVLSPFSAKRLERALNHIVQAYESKFGSFDAKSSKYIESSPIPIGTTEPTTSKARKATERAELLFQLVKNLNVEFGLERSFKISKKVLLGNRFLMTISKNSIKKRPHKTLLDICKKTDMPDNLLEIFMENQLDANYVHFGFEENEKACVYKVYLEFWTDWETEIENKQNKLDPFLLHLGFKWEAFNNKKNALTRYTCHPAIPLGNIQGKLSDIFDTQLNRNPYEITDGMLRIASERVTHDKILYLEVTEENTPRKSFDINMYKAKIQLSELYPLFTKMCQHYSIPIDVFQKLYEPIKSKLFGHISGGIDREGRDFLTIYYGVEGH